MNEQQLIKAIEDLKDEIELLKIDFSIKELSLRKAEADLQFLRDQTALENQKTKKQKP